MVRDFQNTCLHKITTVTASVELFGNAFQIFIILTSVIVDSIFESEFFTIFVISLLVI